MQSTFLFLFFSLLISLPVCERAGAQESFRKITPGPGCLSAALIQYFEPGRFLPLVRDTIECMNYEVNQTRAAGKHFELRVKALHAFVASLDESQRFLDQVECDGYYIHRHRADTYCKTPLWACKEQGSAVVCLDAEIAPDGRSNW